MKKLKKYDKNVATRISDADYEFLAEYSLSQNLNMSEVLRDLLLSKLEELRTNKNQ